MYIHKALKMSLYIVRNLINCSSDQRISIFPLWSRERTECKVVYNANGSFLKALFSELVHLNGCCHLCSHCIFFDGSWWHWAALGRMRAWWQSSLTNVETSLSQNWCWIQAVSTCSDQSVYFDQPVQWNWKFTLTPRH